MNEPTDVEVERYARALWDAREETSDGEMMGTRDARAWDAYPGQGEDEGDCGRFEYWRKDHRKLAREMLRRLGS